MTTLHDPLYNNNQTVHNCPDYHNTNVGRVSTHLWIHQSPTNNQDMLFYLQNEDLHPNTTYQMQNNENSSITTKESIVDDFLQDKLRTDSNMGSRDRTDAWIEQHNSLPWHLEDATSLGIVPFSHSICSFKGENHVGDSSSLSSPNTTFSTPADSSDRTLCSSSLSSNSITEFEKFSGLHQNLSATTNICDQIKLEVEFLPSTENSKKDSTKFTKSAQVVVSPDESRPPTVYAARSRPIDISIKCSHQPPAGSRLRFLVFSLTGGLRSPVVGSDGPLGGSDNWQNLCFVQQSIHHSANSVNPGYYEQLSGGFLALSIPVIQKEFITTLVFPFHNSKCITSLRKDVRLNITLINSINEPISETQFQLISCYSPVRDAMRHREKINPSDKESSRSIKDSNQKRANKVASNSPCAGPPLKKSKSNEESAAVTEVDGRLKYIIMTDNFEIWKILENLRQQLTPMIETNSPKTA